MRAWFTVAMLGLAASALPQLLPARAADESAIPNFGMDARVGWVAGVPDSKDPIGDDFLPPPSGPGPVTSDPAHPYIDNQYAALGKPRRVVTTHDVRDALDAVLAGRAVAHPETEAFGCFIASR